MIAFRAEIHAGGEVRLVWSCECGEEHWIAGPDAQMRRVAEAILAARDRLGGGSETASRACGGAAPGRAGMNGHWREIIAWVRSVGGEDPCIEQHAGHAKLRFLWKGRPRAFSIAVTPSDGNAGYAMRRVLRHELGLVGGEKTVRARRHRKRRRLTPELDRRRRLPRNLCPAATHNTPFAGLAALFGAPAARGPPG